MPLPLCSEIDLGKCKFTPMYKADDRQRVDITLQTGRKVLFQLCDVHEPCKCKYPLDRVQEDAADKTRRGQALILTDPNVVDNFRALDERIIELAMEHQKDWFKAKTPLSEDTIRDRYRSILRKYNEEDEHYYIKFKVKVDGSRVPTKLHKVNADGKVAENRGRVEDLERHECTMAPILSAFGLYFTGGGASFGISFQAEEIVYTSPSKQPLSNFSSKRPIEVTDVSDEIGDEEVSAKCHRVDSGDNEV